MAPRAGCRMHWRSRLFLLGRAVTAFPAPMTHPAMATHLRQFLSGDLAVFIGIDTFEHRHAAIFELVNGDNAVTIGVALFEHALLAGLHTLLALGLILFPSARFIGARSYEGTRIYEQPATSILKNP